jgi:hypothetical protein
MSHHRHSPHRLPTGSSRRSSLLALAALQAAFFASASADTVAYWNFNSLSIPSAALPGIGGVPTGIASDIGSGSVSLANWPSTVDDFAGSTLNVLNSDPAEEALCLLATGTSPFVGNGGSIDISVSMTGFSDPVISYATRYSSSTAFNNGTWSYSLDGSTFNAITGGAIPVTSSSFSVKTLDLSSLNDLDGAASVTLRYTLSGATSAGGNNRIDNLHIEATSNVVDVTPPVASIFSPPDDASGFDGTGYSKLSLTFNEPITLGTGNILVKRVADDSIAYTFDVTDFDQVDLNVSVLGLTLPTPLADNTAYYVEIPATAITDQAAIPNAFAGFGRNDNGTPGDPLDDTFVWNFTTAPAPAAPTVAVNKYLNTATATTELVELLAIGNGTPGTTVDLRGMIVKDFTTNMTADGGGKFEFTDDTLWDDLPVGTLVVLSNNSTSSDTDPADFVVRVGLQDPVYFENPSGSWEISNTDMVMIKAAGSGASGTTGGIHALGGGAAGSLFSLFPGAKVLASTGTNGVIATNPTATVADFTEGTGATGGVALAPADFGTWNNATNRAYILGLRGINPGEGDGIATISNDTASSPFLGSTVFGKGLTGQTAKITVNSTNSAITLTDVVVTVPAGFGVPSSVTLSGAGGTVASFTVAGQVITIQTAAATNTDPLVVTIDALDSPNPGLLTDDGTYEFGISTSSAGGVPSTIADPPVARVPVPIEALRDVTAAGVPLDLGDIVAVEGVVTESDFGDGTANFSGFLQDATAGISIFSSVNNPALVEGNRFVVLGTVSQSNGLTRIVPSAISNMVFNLGADTPPAPEVLTLATLLADPEAYEGSLVTVQNLTYVSGTWAPANTVVLKNSTPTNIDVRIQAGSTVSGAPGSPTPFAAINVTGVFGQFDGSNPFTSGYQIMPRRQSDLTEGTVSDFDLWAAATGATGGMTGDSDFDGRDNAFEYAFGLNPTSGGSVNPFVVPFNPATGLFTYTRRTQSLTGLAYTYQYSTTLSAPWTNFTPAVTPVTNNGDPVEQITVTVPAALLTEPKLFIRVVTP